jgi:radical SAM-linked protein
MQRPAPPGPPPAPVAQRLVIRYAKRGRMRFASHRDIARAVERGVRKAGLPVAYSAGFSPHPKISYSGGATTGTASEAEYLEISLTGACTAADVRDRLDAALPDGIDVTEVFDLADATDGLALEASEWRVVLPGIEPGDAARAVQAFLAADSAPVDRLTSKGTRRLETRSAVLELELDRRAGEGQDAGCAILRMVVRHMTPAVRPDDILAALGHVAALAPSSPPLVTRLAQGPIGMASAAAGISVPGSPGSAGSSGLAGPSGPVPPVAAAPPPSGLSATQGQEKATRREAEGIAEMSTAPVSAYEQLPRGAEGRDSGPRAREPDGRDCPDARERAIQHGFRQ